MFNHYKNLAKIKEEQIKVQARITRGNETSAPLDFTEFESLSESNPTKQGGFTSPASSL